jgi:phage gpG-like protein
MANMQNYSQAQNIIKNLINRISNLKPVFEDFIISYQRIIKEAFQTRGAIFGKRWAEYTKNRINNKGKFVSNYKKRRLPRNMLIQSSRLYGATQGGAGFFKTITNKSCTFGINSSIPYARIHQYGGKTGKNNRANMPQRAYFMNYDNKSIPVRALNFLQDELQKEFNKVGNIG